MCTLQHLEPEVQLGDIPPRNDDKDKNVAVSSEHEVSTDKTTHYTPKNGTPTYDKTEKDKNREIIEAICDP